MALNVLYSVHLYQGLRRTMRKRNYTIHHPNAVDFGLRRVIYPVLLLPWQVARLFSKCVCVCVFFNPILKLSELPEF